MFQQKIVAGAVFHAASKRRREVEFTVELRALTEKAVSDLRALLDAGKVPTMPYEPRCEHCSLYEICLPKITGAPANQLERSQKVLWSV